MKQKTEQIQKLTDYLLEKYGSANIKLTDYWDADYTAIGLSDKTMQYTVYITDNGNSDDFFCVSLENPPISEGVPYSPDENFNKLTAKELEIILVKHLKIIP